MNKLTEALTNANIPVPSKDTETFKIVRWGRNNRYWLKKFDGGYVFGDFVTGLNDHVFERNFKGERLKNAQNCILKAYAHVEPLSIPINEHAASVAQNIFTYSQLCPTNHDYLAQKRVLSHGLKEHK